jgi:hypothetical protein
MPLAGMKTFHVVKMEFVRTNGRYTDIEILVSGCARLYSDNIFRKNKYPFIFEKGKCVGSINDAQHGPNFRSRKRRFPCVRINH